MARPKPPRECKALDCVVRFVPKVPRQEYHDPECRERMAAIRAEERKVKRALKLASGEGKGHKDRLPSAYLGEGVTRQGKVLADIRFEMDQDPAAGTPVVMRSRVQGVVGAWKHDGKDLLYGCLVLLAACAASWAVRLDAPISRMKRPVRKLRSAA